MHFRTSALVFLSLIFSPIVLIASQFISRDGTIISRNEVIEDDLYVFGNLVEMYGGVDGDLSVFCYDIEAEGEIAGNANIFAYRMDLGGNIEKSVRLFGYDINVLGEIGRNMMAFGRKIEIDRGAVIGRDLICAGEIICIDGTVRGDLKAEGESIIISGMIEGDVEIEAKELSIISPAIIKGRLTYTSKDEALIDEDVVIDGKTEWKLPEVEEEDKGGLSWFSVFLRVALFVMALVTGLALIILFKKHTNESSVQIEGRFWYTFAIGFLTLAILAGSAFLLLILIIGVPLSIFLTCLGIFLLYVGKIYVSIVLGRLIFRRFAGGGKFALGWELLVGLIVLSLLFQIPVIGSIIYVLSFILGTGAAVSGYLSLNKKYNEIIRATAPSVAT